MNKQAIIDRFEGAKAVLELSSRKMLIIDRTSLPPGAAEGDVVYCKDQEWHLDPAATEARKLEISQLIHKDGV